MKNNSPTIGSQHLLQRAVNRHPELLRAALLKSGALSDTESIAWKSPLAADDYREYRDMAALKQLEIESKLTVSLKDFWPRWGPVWDGLGVASTGRPLLIGAKAHIPEAASPGTKASPKSLAQIGKSLYATRQHLAPKSTAIWTGTYYQYANRLAHQYYLRVLNGLDSHLIFLNFTNAVDVDGPATEADWRDATRIIHAVLGLPAELERFGIFHAYLDARQLTEMP